MKRNIMSKLLIALIAISAVLLLSACGSSTLKEAQKAFDAGEYEQAIGIITESEENLAENEELNSLYISCYEKWSEELIAAGDYESAINNIGNSGIVLNKGDHIADLYVEACQKQTDKYIDEKSYFQAFDFLSQMIDWGMITSEDAKETYYSIGEGLYEAKYFAQAGIAYANAGDYNDASKKCKTSWDKGAYRTTISIDDYIAVGILADGTVSYTKNDELIDEHGTTSAVGRARKNMKLDVGSWKDIVSVIATNYNCAGLTESGSVVTDVTGAKLWDDDDYSLNTSGWTDIVAISLDGKVLAGLDKYGKVHLTGSESSDFKGAEDWTNIVNVSMSWNTLTGVDAFGHVHAINNYNGDETDDPENIPYEESEFSGQDVRQISNALSYGAYVTEDGTLKTTINQDRADRIKFMTELSDIPMDINDFKGFSAESGKGFVQCEAGYMNYVGLKNDGTVKVGGDMGERLEGFGAKDWKDIKEVHVGISDLNPVIAGVTSDGTLKLAGFEGGSYIPFHERIRGWGKLKAPTVEYSLH